MLWITNPGFITWQEGDKSDDPWDVDNQLSKQLPDLPEVMFNAGISYSGEKLRARLWVNFVDEREHMDGNALAVFDSYTLVNAYASYRIYSSPKAKLDVELTGANLFDESYEEEEGCPMPGALVMAGVRLTF